MSQSDAATPGTIYDRDAILAMHTNTWSSSYTSKGFAEASGDAVRDQFRFFLDAWQDLHFHTIRLDSAEDLIVHKYEITGTLTQQFPRSFGLFATASLCGDLLLVGMPRE
jgi:hypothetical protein